MEAALKEEMGRFEQDRSKDGLSRGFSDGFFNKFITQTEELLREDWEAKNRKDERRCQRNHGETLKRILDRMNRNKEVATAAAAAATAAMKRRQERQEPARQRAAVAGMATTVEMRVMRASASRIMT